MGLFSGNKKEYTEADDVRLASPKDVLTNVLKGVSGSGLSRSTGYNIYYNIVAFKGVKDGLGTSTLVANTAIALAKKGVKVCVVDTSILNSCQDTLLKTNYWNYEPKDRYDWFDMGFTKKSVLHQSGYSSNIAVLSIIKDRSIVDLLSTNDTESMVSLAFPQLTATFDIVLVDICSEPSAIATAAMQQSQKVIQVWSNAPSVLINIANFERNNTICSCPPDKSRYVITSNTVDDIKTDWESLFNKYKFKHLAHVGMSLDIARVCATGKPVYMYPSNSEDIQEFTDCVDDIVSHLLNLEAEIEFHKGKLTVEDIMNGKVEGTLSKKFADANGDFPEIATTLDEASAQLNGTSNKTETKEPESVVQPTSSTPVADEHMKQYQEQTDDLDLFDAVDGVPDDTSEKLEKKRKRFGRKDGEK